jgi:hypothetical protein
MPESEPKSSHALSVIPADKPLRISRAIAAEIVVPAIIADAGDQAARRFLEFFAATHLTHKGFRQFGLHMSHVPVFARARYLCKNSALKQPSA